MDRGLAVNFVKQCNACRNRHVRKVTCRAYPDGIPDIILLGDHDHRIAYTGDQGIRFEAKDKKT